MLHDLILKYFSFFILEQPTRRWLGFTVKFFNLLTHPLWTGARERRRIFLCTGLKCSHSELKCMYNLLVIYHPAYRHRLVFVVNTNHLHGIDKREVSKAQRGHVIMIKSRRQFGGGAFMVRVKRVTQSSDASFRLSCFQYDNWSWSCSFILACKRRFPVSR